MTRTYTLKKRAEQQADTRRRIVEAAVDLHSSIGPAATTFSLIAERAGVQRHTLYAHFPDERSVFAACSGLTMERDPLPDVAPWRAIADPRARLQTGLEAIYGWFARNEQLVGCVLRDAEHHEITRETAAATFAPMFASYQAVLGGGLAGTQQAMLHLAVSFYTWRSLVRDSGLSQADAVAAMVRAIDGAAS